MEKGQISFDLILTIIIMIVLLQVIQGIVTQIEYTQEKASLEYQTKQVQSDIKQIINAKNWLENGKITYKFPEIRTSKNGKIDCGISLQNNTITITVPEKEIEISTQTIGQTNNFNAKCGETITIK